jgi:type IV secretion system protein VirB8
MQKHDQEISDKIKNGSYFSDVLEWYMEEFVHPITQRSFLIVVFVVLATTLALNILNISNISYNNLMVALPIKVNHSSKDYFSFIKPIAIGRESTQEAVARYSVEDYIRTREEYFPAGSSTSALSLKERSKKVKSSSSKNILNEYNNYMTDSNPYSPILRYKNESKREIVIKSVVFEGGDKTSGKAKVLFQATVTSNKEGAKPEISLWEAAVHFRLPDIETIAKTGAPLRFVVKYYRAKLIKK